MSVLEVKLQKANALLRKIYERLSMLDDCGDIGGAVRDEVDMLKAYFDNTTTERKMPTSDQYYWIINHPRIGHPSTQGNIIFSPHMVNPDTNEIDDNTVLNIKPVWFVELSKLAPHTVNGSKEVLVDTHFCELDCGGDTAPLAVDALYNKVLELYGDYSIDLTNPLKTL